MVCSLTLCALLLIPRQAIFLSEKASVAAKFSGLLMFESALSCLPSALQPQLIRRNTLNVIVKYSVEKEHALHARCAELVRRPPPCQASIMPGSYER
jgi:hypothetical protein